MLLKNIHTRLRFVSARNNTSKSNQKRRVCAISDTSRLDYEPSWPHSAGRGLIGTMLKPPEEPDLSVINDLIASANRLLLDCDHYGLALIAIDISSAIDKLEARKRELSE